MVLLALLMLVALIGSVLCVLAAREDRPDDDVEYVYVYADAAAAPRR